MALDANNIRLKVSDAWRISPVDGHRHWFPRFFEAPDGSLWQSDSTGEDSIEANRQEKGGSMRRSFDKGKTWEEMDVAVHQGYSVILADNLIRNFSYIMFVRDDGQVYGLQHDWLPETKSWTEPKPYLVNIAPTLIHPHQVAGVVLDRTILREPDGSLLATIYGRLAGQAKYHVALIRSVDDGQTWDYVSTIAFDPDIPGEGYCEPVMARVADGSLLVVMRTGGGMERKYPMHQSRSLDNGQTWSAPENLGVYSVDPDLCLMSNGGLACSFGRPTMDIMFSPDGSGHTWTKPTTLFSGSSTCYSGICEVEPGRLLLTYDSNREGSPWKANDNQINAVYIDIDA